MKLLIAEDDLTSRTMLCSVVAKWGYEVIATEDGEAAWQAMQEDQPPRLLLIDWEMPKLNGMELCKRIREQENSDPPYIILLTARNDTSDIVSGLESGANEFVSKPFEVAELQARLEVGRRVLNLQADLITSKNEFADQSTKLSAVINNIADGFITINQEGIIESFNPAASYMFGYSPDEVIGKNVKVLMPAPYQNEHDSYLKNYRETGEKKVIGIGAEFVGLRKNGTTFPLELSISEVIIGNDKHFIGITRDITERKEIEKAHQEFISVVSHELRTPITAIKGSLDLILGGVMGEFPEATMNMLSVAQNNSVRLVVLINDILDMEKITAGKMELNYTVTNLISVIKQSVISNKGYGDNLHVSFDFVAGEVDEVMVRIDEIRLAQVMSNLLSNAAKYSPTNDSVEVSVEVSNKNVRVLVHDNGKGIPEEFKSKIFGKFSQADSSDTRKKGGSGLGLNISKAIIEKHGGNIGFDCVENRGTTFYFDLPIWFE